MPNAVSQISFSSEESVPLKKPTTIPEVAKQRELSGTLQRESDSKLKKQVSVAKTKELSGNDIFGPPPEIVSRPLAARILEKEKKDISEPAVRAIHTSVKVSNVSSSMIPGCETTFIGLSFMFFLDSHCLAFIFLACGRSEQHNVWG